MILYDIDAMKRYLIFLPLVVGAAGCPVFQRQDTPVDVQVTREPQSEAEYRLYVPSYYSPDRQWPLVVTLHGTHGWDDSRRQIMEWKYLAERKGLLVVAPKLKSVQGILPVNKSLWRKDLRRDEKVILAVMDELADKYSIDPKAVLLTGFSAGGYPLYFVGLRNPERFNMLIARSCNSSIDIFEQIELTPAARKLPIMIYWGKDDLQEIHRQSWQAIRWLGERGFNRMDYDKIEGGHRRTPEIAYRHWRKILPKRYRR